MTLHGDLVPAEHTIPASDRLSIMWAMASRGQR